MIFCSKCQSVTYCDNDCRKLNWKRHKFFCLLGRPLDEADFLVQSCQTGEHPADEKVLKAFGFWHFKSGLERVQLFQLYGKLVNHGVGDEELREAWQRDKLKEFILSRCSQLPPFLFAREKTWISQQQGFGKDSEAGLGKQLESILMFLNAEDQKLSFSQLEPEVKRMACLFYGQILNQFVPEFDEDNWISLGFCTARSQEETQVLAHLYSLLIQRCTFEEIWKAMDNSTRVELFRTYDLGSNISRMRNFETLMRGVGKWHQSVWELKKFTQSSENKPTRSVYTDYGFQHCQSPQEHIDLRRIYTKFFARGEDEMELHQACIDGRLAQFLTSKLGPLQVPDEVLSNDYPIEGCTYMGMTAKIVIMCPESIYPVVLAKQEAEGGKELIITVPDEQDETMRNYVRDQAAFTTGRMRLTQTTSRGIEIITMNVDW